MTEAKRIKKEAEKTLKRPDPNNEREQTLKVVYDGDVKKYKRVDKAELDLEEAEKKIKELTAHISKEEDYRKTYDKKKEELAFKRQQREEEAKRMKMYQKIMESKKGVSAEEVEKFKDIYGCNEEESAAVLLLNKENVPDNYADPEKDLGQA